MRITDLKNHAKFRDPPIVCLTAYSARIASLLDPHVDFLLVGDSLAMVLYGMETTRDVSLEIMIRHATAVAGSARHADVIVDLPFGTYEKSPDQALENTRKTLEQSGAAAVKIEGGTEIAPTIRHLSGHGFPVIAHIGLLPQTAGRNMTVRGRTAQDAKQLEQDARAVEESGAKAVVIEAVQADTASRLTKALTIPTIGIGASSECDGQVLVSDDMLGLTGQKIPKFVRRYADIDKRIDRAARDFARDVRNRSFPATDELYLTYEGKNCEGRKKR